MATTWINRGHFYVPHVRPVLADCQFVVSAADAGGLGITTLKGQAVQNVFMHTSQTAGKGANGVLNPNPAAGYILVQLTDNFMRMYGTRATLRSPLSGNSLNVDASDAALTVGAVYVIKTLGTSTAADWLALGVPFGVAAVVGVSFTALATGAGTGTGTVQAIAAAGSTIDHVEVVGDPNFSLNPVPTGGTPSVGGWVTLACFGKSLTMNSYTPAGTNNSSTPPVFTGSAATLTGTVSNLIKAPADNTTINLEFYLSQSSVKVAGE